MSDLVIRRTALEPLDRHPAAVYLARLSPGSRRAMRHALDTIAAVMSSGRADAESLDWSALRYQHTQAIRAALAARYAAATTNRALSALRGVLRECWRLGLIDADDHRRAADVANVTATTLPRGRALTTGELRALFAACTGPSSGPRDAALIAVLYGGGLRRSEVVALDLADVDTVTGAITVRHGKGDRARLVYVPPSALRAVSAWLEVRGTDAGPLFLPVTKAGQVVERRMTDQAVLAILARRGRAAGLARFSPHDLRRSFVSDLLDAGADIATVQKLAGHANVQTTARYDRRGEVAKQRAAELLYIPFGK